MKKIFFSCFFACIFFCLSCNHDSNVVATVRNISPGCGYALFFGTRYYLPDEPIPAQFQQDSLKVEIIFTPTDQKIYCDSLFDSLEVINIKEIRL